MATLAARTGVAVKLQEGEAITVVNTYGKQVVDTWAIALADRSRFMSSLHTSMHNGRLLVAKGDDLVDNTRCPIIRLEGGTYEGQHDFLVPSCDIYRYHQLGVEGYHANCCDNFRRALHETGEKDVLSFVPQPLNLFMNVPIGRDGALSIVAPTAGQGDTVILRSLQDVILVMSACPQDLAATNGPGRAPTGIDFELHPS